MSLSREIPAIGAESALLIIDMANYNCKLGSGFYKNSTFQTLTPNAQYYFSRLKESVIPNIQKLIELYRSKNYDIVWTCIESLTPDGRDMSLDYKISNLFVAKDSYEAKVIDELDKKDSDVYLPKTSCNVFCSTNVEYVLRNMGAKYVTIVGVCTDQCVSGAVRSACDRGFYVTLPRDACTTHGKNAHESELKTLKGFSRIISTSELLEELGSQPAKPKTPPYSSSWTAYRKANL